MAATCAASHVGQVVDFHRLDRLGQVNRLAGADASIFPNYGGRFCFTRDDCRRLADGAVSPMGHIKPMFPTPAGGMSLDRVGEMCEMYGCDAIFLIGGGLYRFGTDLVESCREFGRRVDSNRRGEMEPQTHAPGRSAGVNTDERR